MEENILIFGKEGINQNLFHKHKPLTSIDKADIRRIALSDNDLHGKKVRLNNLLNI